VRPLERGHAPISDRNQQAQTCGAPVAPLRRFARDLQPRGQRLARHPLLTRLGTAEQQRTRSSGPPEPQNRLRLPLL